MGQNKNKKNGSGVELSARNENVVFKNPKDEKTNIDANNVLVYFKKYEWKLYSFLKAL